MDYTKANSLLQGRNANSRKIGNNTYLIRRDSYIAIKLHNTEIIQYYPDKIVLNTGGWNTVTTKARMNEYLDNFSIWQEKSRWYIHSYGEQNKIPYYDGIELSYNGSILSNHVEELISDKQEKALKKYASDYITALFNNQVPFPSNGDCLFCSASLRTNEGKTLGEASRDTKHLLSHFKEKYYVPSILYRAVETFPVSQAVKHELGCIWSNSSNDSIPTWKDFARKDLKKVLVRYLKRQFGLAS